MRHDQRAAHGLAPSTSQRLFEQYWERIVAYCHRVMRDSGDAEDAAQTTFLYAHRALLRGVSPENECAWLHAIAENVCRTQKRSAVRRRLVTGVELDLIPGPDRADGDWAELAADLSHALAAMPDGQRRALVLREWRGLSSKEIAAELGLSPPATYALLTRARRSLARALTLSGRRPALGLDFGAFLLKLKGLVAGAAAKTVATTVVVAGVALGGAAIERTVVDREAPATSGPAAPGPSAGASQTVRLAGVESGARAPARPQSGEAPARRTDATGAAETVSEREPFVGLPRPAAPTTPRTIPMEDPRAPSSDGTSDSDAEDALADASGLADSLVDDVVEAVPDVGVDLPPLPIEPPPLDERDLSAEDPLGDALPDAPPTSLTP